MLSQAIEREPLSPPVLSEDDQWNAVVRRDPTADHAFYCAVLTTGVTCADAEKAGFRPCKRCRPNAASLVELPSAVARSRALLDREAAA